jgi:NitT/TauT family transport system substrate-binding protein
MRKGWIAGAALALVALSTPAAAQDKVSLRLNWLLYGFHTPFYLGVERGYYKDERIDLTIGEGQGSVRAVQTVGAKGDTFGLADGAALSQASAAARRCVRSWRSPTLRPTRLPCAPTAA